MKALAIRQPWAWAVINGIKDIENREWGESYPARRFAERFRGRFVVHASANHLSDARWNEEWDGYCDTALRAWRAGGTGCAEAHEVIPDVSEDLSFGRLLGTVELIAVVTQSPSPWFFGPVGLVLREPRRFTQPIPFSGRQGFFDVPDELLPPEACAA